MILWALEHTSALAQKKLKFDSNLADNIETNTVLGKGSLVK